MERLWGLRFPMTAFLKPQLLKKWNCRDMLQNRPVTLLHILYLNSNEFLISMHDVSIARNQIESVQMSFSGQAFRSLSMRHPSMTSFPWSFSPELPVKKCDLLRNIWYEERKLDLQFRDGRAVQQALYKDAAAVGAGSLSLSLNS